MKNSLKRSPVWMPLGVGLFMLAGMAVWCWGEIRVFTFSEAYMPHAFCFLGNRGLILLHVVSDGLTGLSYFVVAGLLMLIAYRNRRLIPFPWMFLAFGAFIACCGVTHVLSIVVLWWPFYWLEGEAKLVTAAASILAACLLPPLAPRIKRLLEDAELTAHAQSELEEALESLRHAAAHDSLTGLPTRTLFADRLEVALARQKRFGEPMAVLMVDVDNFKGINDTLGHHAGDEVLVAIAQRLRTCVRATDTVARIGGDEFMLILCNVHDGMVEDLAAKIVAAVGLPIHVGSDQLTITASVGVCAEVTDVDPVELLKHADMALYRAKADGKNRFQRYSAGMARTAADGASL